MSVRAEGDPKRPRESEIGQLEVTFLIDEKILRLQIAMQNPMRVEVVRSLDELISLIHEGAC